MVFTRNHLTLLFITEEEEEQTCKVLPPLRIYDTTETNLWPRIENFASKLNKIKFKFVLLLLLRLHEMNAMQIIIMANDNGKQQLSQGHKKSILKVFVSN